MKVWLSSPFLSLELLLHSSSTSFSSSFSFRSIYSAEEEAVERLVHFVHGTLHLVSRYYLTTVVTSSPELRYRPLCRYCAPEASGAKYKYKRLSDPAVKKNGVTLNVFASVIVASAEREAVYTR